MYFHSISVFHPMGLGGPCVYRAERIDPLYLWVSYEVPERQRSFLWVGNKQNKMIQLLLPTS